MNNLFEAYHLGLLQKKYWLNNAVAGLIVGVVSLPLAMAFAIASGVSPEQGLYTAVIAGFIVTVFGGSRFQIAGPTGAFVVVLAGVTEQYGVSGLQLASFMAGFILLFFGLARFGSVIKFIPAPVIVGFTSGIALVIFIGQWPYFFGVPAPIGKHFHDKLWNLLASLHQLKYATTALGLGSLFVLLFANKIPFLKKIPAPLIALVGATLIQSYFHFAGVATIGTQFGGVPQGLPAFSWLDITSDRLLELVGPAFTIAMLGAIESLLSAVVADGMSGTLHNSNRELIAQGLANIIAPLFGGFASTGAIARTATNIRSGANSPVAGLVHALFLLLVILFLAPLATNIPLTTLAAVLFVVAWNMSEAKHFVKLIQVAPRADVVVLVVTFFLTVFVDLVMAVNIGVIIAVLHFLRRMSSSVAVQQMTDKQLAIELAQNNVVANLDGTLVYAIEGPFFFASVEVFQRALAAIHADPNVLVLRLRWVPFIDMTGLQALREIIEDLQQRKVLVKLCEANQLVENKLRKAGIITLIHEENLYQELSAALSNQ